MVEKLPTYLTPGSHAWLHIEGKKFPVVIDARQGGVYRVRLDDGTTALALTANVTRRTYTNTGGEDRV